MEPLQNLYGCPYRHRKPRPLNPENLNLKPETLTITTKSPQCFEVPGGAGAGRGQHRFEVLWLQGFGVRAGF